MADILEQEALEAWDERKRKARVLGESGSNKASGAYGDDAGCCNGNYYDSCISVLLWIKKQERGGEYMKNCGNWQRDLPQKRMQFGVVEIILILVVLIGLVIIFKEQLTSLVKNILSKITKQSNSI